MSKKVNRLRQRLAVLESSLRKLRRRESKLRNIFFEEGIRLIVEFEDGKRITVSKGAIQAFTHDQNGLAMQVMATSEYRDIKLRERYGDK